eukprot:2824110-Pleurochrysis_carterae.AAC.1
MKCVRRVEAPSAQLVYMAHSWRSSAIVPQYRDYADVRGVTYLKYEVCVITLPPAGSASSFRPNPHMT